MLLYNYDRIISNECTKCRTLVQRCYFERINFSINKSSRKSIIIDEQCVSVLSSSAQIRA